MKYMTPDLIARTRSEDEEVIDAADAEWEQACNKYNARLREIRPKLPKSVRFLLDQLSLHDAKVFTMTFDEAPYFSIFLQPEDPSQGPIELKYRLATAPRLGPHKSLVGDGKPFQWWLYDEIDMDEGRYFFTHSILFTGGYELQVPFINVACSRLKWALILGSPPEIASLLENACLLPLAG